MIVKLGITYHISPREAEQLSELDYFEMVGNINLDTEREMFIQRTYKPK